MDTVLGKKISYDSRAGDDSSAEDEERVPLLQQPQHASS
eukprot:CAMPEP_0172900944 /NCGR_PEP_ID=MMETSP1075-20121228/165178_1 /TAXON_ID=2916 /ORGANISM="Ceratium fusus, Strain PA161109" /LENGTH=38 /DNA_ID= /DNA_START= /DNA_END= /DNA_ORIENTATION=